MKKLSKKEFKKECSKLQFKGKCAVLLFDNKLQNINRVTLKYLHNSLEDVGLVTSIIDSDTSAVLINFEISSKFPFYKVEELMYEILKYIPDEIDLVLTATYDDTKDIESADIVLVTSTQPRVKILFSKLFNAFM